MKIKGFTDITNETGFQRFIIDNGMTRWKFEHVNGESPIEVKHFSEGGIIGKIKYDCNPYDGIHRDVQFKAGQTVKFLTDGEYKII